MTELEETQLRATRHARARAFVKQGLGKGKTWADMRYDYDTPEPPAEGNDDHANTHTTPARDAADSDTLLLVRHLLPDERRP